MIRFLAAALLCLVSVCSVSPALAGSCIETGTVMVPICGMTSPGIWQTADGRSVKSIRVTMDRVTRATREKIAHVQDTESIARPVRYISGRLICAINVGAALAERGIKGTGSALARSYDLWGVRTNHPIPGKTVAVTDRRGGGHVALVSRVEGSRIFVWNPSPRGRGWEEVEYTHRHARYRVAS